VIATPYESKNHGPFSTGDESEQETIANGRELTRIKAKESEPQMDADLRR